jgi:hypothetical protein
MVWGMTLPESFGEFWPSGAFESTSLGHQGMPEGQKAFFDDGHGNGMLHYMGYAVGKFKNEVGTSVGNDPPFTLIEAHEPPKFFTTEKGQKILGSLIMLNDSILAVDEALKAIVERLEPGVHRFYPLEIRMPRGIVYLASYYTLVIGQYFDAFSGEHTLTGSARERASGSFMPDISKAGMNGIAVRNAVFGNAHLWRDRTFKVELACFSDELQVEIAKAGLQIPKHYKLKAV